MNCIDIRAVKKRRMGYVEGCLLSCKAYRVASGYCADQRGSAGTIIIIAHYKTVYIRIVNVKCCVVRWGFMTTWRDEKEKMRKGRRKHLSFPQPLKMGLSAAIY